jgi:hypothetical protein
MTISKGENQSAEITIGMTTLDEQLANLESIIEI